MIRLWLLLLFCLMVFSSPGQDGFIWSENGTKVITKDLYYSPAVHNVSLFQGKKELTVNAFMISALGVNAAYAPFNHLSISAGYGVTKRDERYIHTYEAGAGYFNSFGRTNQWIYELTIAGGHGSGDIKLEGRDFREELSYNKTSVQGAFGFRRKIMEFSLSPRYTYFIFYNHNKLYEGDNHPWLYGDELEGSSHSVIETNLITRVGHENIKFGAQLGFPIMLKKQSKEINFYDHITFIISASFRWSFQKDVEVK